MRTAVFLPAKGSSDRITNKNTRLLDGMPLFLVTLRKLVDCGLYDEVWLDSESQEIHELASEIDCLHLWRDPALSTNKTDGNRMFMNEVHNTQADLIVQVLCTSPFIEPETMRQGLNVLAEKDEYDSAVLVRRDKRYIWNDFGPAYNKEHIPNSVDLPWSITETMGLYMVRREAALRLGRRIGDRPYLLNASPLEAVDLNDPEDLPLAELIAAGMRERNRKKYTLLQRHLSSPMLSDIMDDLGIKSVIRGLRSNIPGSKILGRAHTLHLRELEPEEDFNGIYKAIESYDHIVPGDVIVVQNDLPEYAYFGELNANMAIKAGAVAAVVGGATRDSDSTIDMSFPVFSQGVSCADVRKRATLASHGRRINISNVNIEKDDLIFADTEGIVVIPRKFEEKILSLAMTAITRERSIISDLLGDCAFNNLYSRHGGF